MKNKFIFLFLFLLNFGNAFSQNGKIISKEIVDLSKAPIWSKISINDTLKNEYEHLKKLNFYFITYQSDSLKVNGIILEPKKEGKYPVVIFNRGGNRDFCSFNNCNSGYVYFQVSRTRLRNYRK